MSFIQAFFLLGGLAVVGPIAAHFLARPRYRRVPFTMLRFLQTGEVESQSRRRLHNLLILLLRCTAIILIALYFAGPERILAAGDTEPVSSLVVAIDDSLSMAYADYFDRARDAVAKRIADAPSGSPIYLVALASGESLETTDAGAAHQFLDRLQPVPLRLQAAPLRSAIDSAIRENGRLPAVYMASDFTAAARDALSGLGERIRVASAGFAAVTAGEAINNSALVGVQIRASEGERLQVSVGLANQGAAPVETQLSATLDGISVDSIPVTLPPQGRTSALMTLPFPEADTPYSSVSLMFAPGDLLQEDNAYYFGLARSAGNARRVVILANDRMEAFLLQTALATLAEANPLDLVGLEVIPHDRFQPADLSGAHMVFLTSPPSPSGPGVDALAEFVRSGGRLVAFATNTDAPFYSELAKAGVLPVRPQYFQQEERRFAPAGTSSMAEAPLRDLRNYRLESLPVTGAWLTIPADSAEVLWTFESGEPFVSRVAAENGEAIFVNTSANDTLSPLMKTPAAVAFASFLTGGTSALHRLAFEAGDTIVLPASSFETEHAGDGGTLYLTAPSDTVLPALLSNDTLVLSGATELGLYATQAKPTRYAGVNVPEGETDMTSPPAGSVELLFDQLFETALAGGGAEENPLEPEREPVWRVIAWLALAVLFAELFISNRMVR